MGQVGTKLGQIGQNWPNLGQKLAKSWPNLGQFWAKIAPFNNSPIRDKIGHFLPNFWPILANFGQFLANFWPIFGQFWPI